MGERPAVLCPQRLWFDDVRSNPIKQILVNFQCLFFFSFQCPLFYICSLAAVWPYRFLLNAQSCLSDKPSWYLLTLEWFRSLLSFLGVPLRAKHCEQLLSLIIIDTAIGTPPVSHCLPRLLVLFQLRRETISAFFTSYFSFIPTSLCRLAVFFFILQNGSRAEKYACWT